MKDRHALSSIYTVKFLGHSRRFYHANSCYVYESYFLESSRFWAVNILLDLDPLLILFGSNLHTAL